MSDDEDMLEFEFQGDGVFPLHQMEKGRVVEITDRTLMKKLKREYEEKFFDMVRKSLEEGKTLEETKKEWLDGGRKLQTEVEHILDSFNNREYAKITSVREINGTITIKIQKLKDGEYKKIIPSLANKIADKLSKKDIVNMMIDVLMDEKADKVQRIAKEIKKEEPKVETKGGCFKIVIGDEELQVRE